MPEVEDPLYPEDAYLGSLAALAALVAALRLGLLRRLELGAMAEAEALQAGPSMHLLLDALEDAGVIARRSGRVVLTPSFAATWARRGRAAEARLDMVARGARDALIRPEALFAQFERFMAEAETFAFFRYDLAKSDGADNLAATERWCAYVGALTSAEAPHLAGAIDLADAGAALEIGGNAGILAEVLLRSHPRLRYTIMDLPAVCGIGERRWAGTPLAGRLEFHPGDARSDPWPGPVDAVLFKSVLHDWPEAEARNMLAKARAALRPGGRVFVVERAPLAGLGRASPATIFADLVFAPFFRAPERYRGWMEAAGFSVLETLWPIPEPPFYVVSGHVS